MSRTGVGGFFAYAGIAFALLGGAVLAGGLAASVEGAAIAGFTFLMIGVIWSVVGFGLRAYYAGVLRRAAVEKKLFESGEKAEAIVEKARVTGTEINNNPVVVLTLRVKPRTGAEFAHERKLCVPPNGIPLPGHVIDVAFDPANRANVALDFDESFSSPPARFIRSRPPAATAPAEEKPGVIDQLERLQKLRESGALTESEFAAQKARILLEG